MANNEPHIKVTKNGKPKLAIMLMKYFSKHLIKMLLNDSQIDINYLKIIEKTPRKKLQKIF